MATQTAEKFTPPSWEELDRQRGLEEKQRQLADTWYEHAQVFADHGISTEKGDDLYNQLVKLDLMRHSLQDEPSALYTLKKRSVELEAEVVEELKACVEAFSEYCDKQVAKLAQAKTKADKKFLTLQVQARAEVQKSFDLSVEMRELHDQYATFERKLPFGLSKKNFRGRKPYYRGDAAEKLELDGSQYCIEYLGKFSQRAMGANWPTSDDLSWWKT